MKDKEKLKFQNLNEIPIWSGLKDHDKDALASFFEKYYSFFFNQGLKIGGDELQWKT